MMIASRKFLGLTVTMKKTHRKSLGVVPRDCECCGNWEASQWALRREQDGILDFLPGSLSSSVEMRIWKMFAR